MHSSKKITIKVLENFIVSAKKLSKKYRNIKNDIKGLEKVLHENPILGTSLGGGMYKIRIANSSKNIGKRGGFRVITYFLSSDNTIYLVEIYDKSSIENISIQTLRKIFNDIL